MEMAGRRAEDSVRIVTQTIWPHGTDVFSLLRYKSFLPTYEHSLRLNIRNYPPLRISKNEQQRTIQRNWLEGAIFHHLGAIKQY